MKASVLLLLLLPDGMVFVQMKWNESERQFLIVECDPQIDAVGFCNCHVCLAHKKLFIPCGKHSIKVVGIKRS
jgi:hypothetical protein